MTSYGYVPLVVSFGGKFSYTYFMLLEETDPSPERRNFFFESNVWLSSSYASNV